MKARRTATEEEMWLKCGEKCTKMFFGLEREKRSNGLAAFKGKTRDKTDQEIVTGIRTLCSKRVTDKEIATKMRMHLKKLRDVNSELWGDDGTTIDMGRV